ncbi:hypothetical protein CANARDRAFT_25845 [[Candida] arabinofermentans NRRL YB-2248]|uniref:Uncharacterized protein n=1 Tax=[Candida] arabinofermentans NRRL YB-2248 TaxID=983967 RepID=A0A1E4SSS8_9ASCO|nr:hypothetical protein CANARDRAFT_25845 [[Candida] arabinofermentans NRRL YB-2248]
MSTMSTVHYEFTTDADITKDEMDNALKEIKGRSEEQESNLLTAVGFRIYLTQVLRSLSIQDIDKLVRAESFNFIPKRIDTVVLKTISKFFNKFIEDRWSHITSGLQQLGQLNKELKELKDTEILETVGETILKRTKTKEEQEQMMKYILAIEELKPGGFTKIYLMGQCGLHESQMALWTMQEEIGKPPEEWSIQEICNET